MDVSFEGIQMLNKYKKYSVSLASENYKWKAEDTTTQLLDWLKLKRLTVEIVYVDVKWMELSSIAGNSVNCSNLCGNMFGIPNQSQHS